MTRIVRMAKGVCQLYHLYFPFQCYNDYSQQLQQFSFTAHIRYMTLYFVDIFSCSSTDLLDQYQTDCISYTNDTLISTTYFKIKLLLICLLSFKLSFFDFFPQCIVLMIFSELKTSRLIIYEVNKVLLLISISRS